MAWSNTKAFMATVEDMFENTCALDVDSDTLKLALYNNSITPSQTVTSANTAYNAGQWATANEVYDSTNWTQTGVALTSVVSGFSSNVYTLTSATVVSPGSATMSNIYGGLLYDNTLASPVAKQGISYHYFGGANSVTAGTFSVIPNASGGWVQLTA